MTEPVDIGVVVDRAQLEQCYSFGTVWAESRTDIDELRGQIAVEDSVVGSLDKHIPSETEHAGAIAQTLRCVLR